MHSVIVTLVKCNCQCCSLPSSQVPSQSQSKRNLGVRVSDLPSSRATYQYILLRTPHTTLTHTTHDTLMSTPSGMFHRAKNNPNARQAQCSPRTEASRPATDWPVRRRTRGASTASAPAAFQLLHLYHQTLRHDPSNQIRASLEPSPIIACRFLTTPYLNTVQYSFDFMHLLHWEPARSLIVNKSNQETHRQLWRLDKARQSPLPRFPSSNYVSFPSFSWGTKCHQFGETPP
ncbi:hypothetical protein V8C44DRAFT_37793 [Trichoderma aethiopicum]